MGLAALVLVAGTALAVALPYVLKDEAAKLVRPKQPSLFYRGAGDALVSPLHLFAIAHNGGDSVEAAHAARAYGASVVEIDVVDAGGKLFVSHDRPLPSLGLLPLDSPPLENVWVIAARAQAVELDLKQSSTLLLQLLVEFLRAHRDVEVIVTSPRVSFLRTLRGETPWVRRFLSVRNRLELTRVRLDPLLEDLQGVSVREDLLDGATVRWLHERHLVVTAWVVNDRGRLDELVSDGVDGVATDNLAILELLQAQGAEEAPSALVGAG
jgi:glycerophosphoryl diester phosphodiesterase